jgi:hypothetical protein
VARELGSPHAVVMAGEIISPDSSDQVFVNLVSWSAGPLERIIARELHISYKAFRYKVKQIGMEETAVPAGPKGLDL